MARLLLILFVGLVFESAGIVFLKRGITQVDTVQTGSAAEILAVIKAGVANGRVWLGVACQAVFFGCLLVLMARSDISFLWPLTALSFIFSTLAAIWFLHERVSSARWAGVVFIMIGAALISYSEHTKPRPEKPVPAQRP